MTDETYPMRVSPDGRDVAIRNLHKIVTVTDDGPQWSTVSSKWLTDAQVADWIPLVTQEEPIIIKKELAGMWEVYRADGTHVTSTPDIGLASAAVLTCVQQAGGAATIVVDNRDTIEYRRASKINLDTGE